MSLTDYRRKRSFDKTREPKPGKAVPKGQRAIFVVQLHHASRRHYDFRLQVGDALKSWAVPKGPSYDPSVKRMAVEVEDHPVDYATFEGEIPKGQYGGGHVAQFDQGVWATDGDPEEQLVQGHLRFELFGTKLKGGWHLVRSGKPAKQPQWLLFKEKDDYAGTLEADDLLADVAKAPAEDLKRAGSGKANKKKLTSVPAKKGRRKDWAKKASALSKAKKGAAPTGPFEPQLAKLGESPPQGEQWIHELKWDGYRILATIAKGEVRLWSRNALEWTAKIPDIRDAVAALGLESGALDGELIAGTGTKQDFNLLQSTLSGERLGKLSYALFDVLHLNGVEVSGAPLLERKALLQDLLEDAPAHLAYSSHIEGDGQAAFELAGEQHFEGIISKRADRPYHGGRSEDWRKTKQLASDEFAVVGYTAPKGSRTGFGSLLLAKPDPEHGWRYVGRVGNGFNDELLREVSKKLAKGGGKMPTAHVGTTDTDLRTATWFPPRFVVEVFFRGIGRQDLLRQPSLKAIRPDKDVGDLADSDRAENLTKAPSLAKAAKATPASKKVGKGGKKAASDAELPKLSSPTKVLFPESRITKQDVWDYYLAVADHLLPEIAGRPLSIIRCPAGIERPCFFQKHLTAGLERVDTVKLKEESGTNANYLVVEDLPGLMELVQFNALEFHPWGSHASEPDRADRVVFDLDPGEGVPFSEIKKAATDIRKLLEQLELESFLRVSGGKGLHVVVPLNPGCDWDLTKRFAHGFADALARSEPDRFLSNATKSKRHKRIFVDYLRNGRGATAVASYSMRGRAGAPVAMPLAWGDLSKLTKANAFTIKDVPAKLKRRRKDPWEGIDRVKQNLARWAQDD
ncbi:DNA ligase D [Stenotrophomonas acidaminiphila]|jgi:bifunctional non-homologous end joining protein LigD|uniref:DNA ligase D n=1 Tax=Stenotrophomonas acidaminiphila TaxID=128780 RepID=UPI0024ADB8CD|nr:DNA ligase D [Stenotrophomonas acidaminiphila]WHL19953.1 DNA ligase D [Stenotrophomonas acidaminiphila]